MIIPEFKERLNLLMAGSMSLLLDDNCETIEDIKRWFEILKADISKEIRLYESKD